MEASKVYSHVLGPTSVVASIICGLAVISNYCFPKQRKFPNVVLVWTWYAPPSMLSQLDSFSLIIILTNRILIFYPVYFSVVDLVLSIYMAVWWIDGPMKRILTDTVEPSSFTCRCTVSSFSFILIFWYLSTSLY